MSNFSDANIDFWIKNNLNVLMRGKHGVGKTTKILAAFKRHGLRFQYFSASTLDAFVDFSGIPVSKTMSDGTSRLEFSLPQWQFDGVEAIFLDEYNRAPKKVRNAVMELIQFKSINGRKFKDLKIVWAAINPEDEEVNQYDVEALDPAQMDRFHINVNVPYQPDAAFFREKFGRDQADIALSWWKESLKDNERDLISPRRLDYMLEVHNMGGDLKPMVHSSINLLPLTQQLKNGPIAKQIENLFDKKDTAGAKKFLSVENNYANAINHIVKKREYVEFFVPQVSNEKILVLMTQHKQVAQMVFGDYDGFKDLIHQLASSKGGQLSAQAASVVMQNVKITDITIDSKWESSATEATLTNKLASLKSVDLTTTQNRTMSYKVLAEHLPEDFHSDVGVEALKIMEKCLCSSHRDTIIREMPELTRMIGHTIRVLDKQGASWKDAVDTKNLMFKLSDVSTYLKQQKELRNPIL